MTDSYKVTHHVQYPPKTQFVFSFFESRGGAFPRALFFGLQYLLKQYLEGQVVTEQKIVEAREFFRAHFGSTDLFNEYGWRHILDRYNGHLPIRIRAVPEGTLVPNHNVLMTVENLDQMVPWLTNYLETLLVQVWYPTTVATQSQAMKRTIMKFLEETGDPALIPFKLHDFGYRGSTSVESAGIGGAAHLVNFMGTDTMEALVVARDYYGEPMAGFSIPAAEHSTVTSWAREVDAFDNMLQQYPSGLVAVVSDSYNIYEACEKLWGEELRDKVLNRNGTLIVRPDSGTPEEVVVKVLTILGARFGYSINEKGYKVLDPHVRVIQGDGIDRLSLMDILANMKIHGWSADNIAFGSGGGLLQKVNRDTLRFAFKCSAVCVDGEWRDVMKNPVTDVSKRSKAGRLGLLPGYLTVPNVPDTENLLKVVFENGRLTRPTTLAEVRSLAG